MNDSRIKIHPILGRIKNKPFLSFTFNGKKFKALKGEMISSALIANGVKVFGKHHKDKSPQGIFCANGQCSQCLVIANGNAVKACITEIQNEMNIFSLEKLPTLPQCDKVTKDIKPTKEYKTDVLIMGAGPAGLSAALELAESGLKIIIADDKKKPGGKLSLQTHNFFGSIEACYAGERGTEIGKILTEKLKYFKNVKLWLNSPVVGIFCDKKIGIVKEGKYVLIEPDIFLIAAGAREKAISFPGSDLPGIYGAGAFQTLVNRDLIKVSKRLFVIGGGNVGLISAYHAIQAGINVIGLVECFPECGGYKVHLDKIKRLGIPIWTSHTVLRAEGNGKLEKIITSKVDKNFNPIPKTEREFEVDTLLIAVGLSPVNEIYKQAIEFGFNAYCAGDSSEIAEASAAIFSGKITGRKVLKSLGYETYIPDTWFDTSEILKSKPGRTYPLSNMISFNFTSKFHPIIRCNQEIPCNPCVDACQFKSIKLTNNTIMDLPVFEGKCFGCGKCVAICPGLAITLVNQEYDSKKKKALVIIPWELPDTFIKLVDIKKTTGFEGNEIGTGKIIKIQSAKWMNNRKLVHIEVPFNEAQLVAGLKLFDNDEGKTPNEVRPIKDEDIIVCRCERVTRKQIIEKIQDGYKDFNALKAELRVGMGACGGKTCLQQIWNIYKEFGVPEDEIEHHAYRPFEQEILMESFINE